MHTCRSGSWFMFQKIKLCPWDSKQLFPEFNNCKGKIKNNSCHHCCPHCLRHRIFPKTPINSVSTESRSLYLQKFSLSSVHSPKDSNSTLKASWRHILFLKNKQKQSFYIKHWCFEQCLDIDPWHQCQLRSTGSASFWSRGSAFVNKGKRADKRAWPQGFCDWVPDFWWSYGQYGIGPRESKVLQPDSACPLELTKIQGKVDTKRSQERPTNTHVKGKPGWPITMLCRAKTAPESLEHLTKVQENLNAM